MESIYGFLSLNHAGGVHPADAGAKTRADVVEDDSGRDCMSNSPRDTGLHKRSWTFLPKEGNDNKK
jgi:hypothetical protein